MPDNTQPSTDVPAPVTVDPEKRVNEWLTILLVTVVGGVAGDMQYLHSYDSWLPPAYGSAQAFLFGVAAAFAGVYVVGDRSVDRGYGKIVAMSFIFGFSGLVILTKAEAAITGDTTATARLDAAEKSVEQEVKKVESTLASTDTNDASQYLKAIARLRSSAEYLLDSADMFDDATLRHVDKQCLLSIWEFYDQCLGKNYYAAVNAAARGICKTAKADGDVMIFNDFAELANVQVPAAKQEAPDQMDGWVKYCTLKSNISGDNINLEDCFAGDRLFHAKSGKFEKALKAPVLGETVGYLADIKANTDVFRHDTFPTADTTTPEFWLTPSFVIKEGTIVHVDQAVRTSTGGDERSIWFHVRLDSKADLTPTSQIVSTN